MEISIGKTIYLDRDYIKKFEPDTKTSKSFQVTAMTDVAVAVKNIRSGRRYTLSLAAVSDNMENPPTPTMPRGKVVRRAPAPEPTPPPVEPDPTPEPPPPVETFTHIPPAVTGGINIKRINAITSVTVEDDPFGGLYG